MHLIFTIIGSIVSGWFYGFSWIKIQEGLNNHYLDDYEKEALYKRSILVSFVLGLVFYFIGW
ncbi:hypothetical protein J5Y03_17450 [Bacillus sp. RG28]|uniref:Uncharacterized protein n=1 Tax=Gottfriedia endophytica TaxID=2820819 RepID=A0A940SI64_9BACI|nr:hypothetical protein [Gottfriedia endophytica]MBP0726947.1 hypothetical protein [Gottfriedia endophytica]